MCVCVCFSVEAREQPCITLRNAMHLFWFHLSLARTHYYAILVCQQVPEILMSYFPLY